MKTVMITGTNGYIGSALIRWFQEKKEYQIIGIDTEKVLPEEIKMQGCDTVIHTAGIAHRRETKQNIHLYYEVNRDYTVKTAQNAKRSGVKQFIVLSSMSVYGKSTGRITKKSSPAPINHYGKSKYEADRKLEKMQSDSFRVCILRPPMVYGKGCKGNYQILKKLAVRTPIFPVWKNRRSMLYIDNLCGFIEELVKEEKAGLFFPQNEEYVCTADMVAKIGAENGHKVRFLNVLNIFVKIKCLPFREKIFGNLIYDCEEDRCRTVEEFGETIRRTEADETNKIENYSGRKRKVMIITNHSGYLFQFRRELIQELSADSEIVLLTPFTGHIDYFRKRGYKCVNIDIDRRGINPFRDFKVLKCYFSTIFSEKPDKVITYSIKPNIYAGFICQLLNVPYYVNIQGLGSAFQNKWLSGFVSLLYKVALRKTCITFFENEANAREFLRRKIISDKKITVLNGAGINLDYFEYKPYPKQKVFHFLFIGRIMKEKGVDELFKILDELQRISDRQVVLDICGFFEDEYKETVEKLAREKKIVYHGYIEDPRPYYERANCIVLPSYHEGMSNVLLEAAAVGRPVVTSNIPGCKEAVKEGETGYLCRVKDSKDLLRVMRKIVEKPEEELEKMGKNARKYMVEVFDKKKVVQCTMKKLGEK